MIWTSSKRLGKKGTEVAAIPALLVALLCTLFAVFVIRQYVYKPRLPQLFWSISLVVSALGSLAYGLAIWMEPHSALVFRFYYLFGALWMAPIMGLGSIALVSTRKVVLWIAGIVGLLGAIGTVLLFLAPVNRSLLLALSGGAGTGIIQPSAWLVFLIVLNSFGAIGVVGVALTSAWMAFRRRSPDRFLYGNFTLGVGVMVITAAGSSARLGWPGLFWIIMLVGWIITFMGFVWLTPTLAVRAVNRQAEV